MASSNASGIVKRTSSYYADPLRIRIQGSGSDKRNTRFDFGDLDADLGSMKTDGFHEHKPLLVKRVVGDPDFDFEIIDGERRLTYVQMLVKKGHVFEGGVPIVIEDKKSTDLDLLVKMFTSNSGKAFLPLEEAHAFKKMRDAGMSIKDIVQRTGRHHSQVNDALALIQSDASVQEAVKDKKISTTLARKISIKARGDKTKQKELVEAATKNGGKDKKKVLEQVSRIERRRVKINPAKVKAKPLGPAMLEELTTKIYEGAVAAMAEAGIGDLDEIKLLASKDSTLTAVFLAGASLALKAASGEKISLEV